MPVRIKIELIYEGIKAEGVAVANSGYMSSEPEIMVPKAFLREKLKISRKGKKQKFMAFDKKETETEFLGKVNVRVITPDKLSHPIQALLFVSEFEDEILLSDALIGDLGLVLLNVKEGKWRFADDSVDKVRQSELKELY